MSTVAKKKPRVRRLAPEGIHAARCIRVIDLGTQRGEWKGKKKISQRVILVWELPQCQTVFNEEHGEEPFVVSRWYNNSLHEKSDLFRDLVSWIGRGFTREAEFELGTLLGKPCLLNIVHEESVKYPGEKTDRVIGVNPIPKGMAVPEQILPSLHYKIEDGFNDVFESLPEGLQETIMRAEELKVTPDEKITERNVRQATTNAQQPSPHPPVGINESSSDDDNGQLEDEVNTQAQLATGANDEPEW